jgi:hypothetical protein
MEPPSFEKLRGFFERIKNTGLFERLFFWRAIVASGYDAFSEYQQLQKFLQEQGRTIAEITAQDRELALTLEHQKEQLIQLQQDLVALGAKNEELVRRMSERENVAGGLVEADRKNQELIGKLNTDIAALTARYEQQHAQSKSDQVAIARYQQRDEERTREHDTRVVELTTLKKQLEEDRLRVQAERDAEIHRQYEEMEQTWKRHEEDVEATLRAICQRHTIGYCDKEKFPYAGKPDNAVVICDQYVIFDAKSPKNSEDLDNFPQYIRTQAEAVKKYMKAGDVKKDVFLVVPANTVGYLDEFHYDMADWQVYVVTGDCLEPVVLALKKVEDYEFAEQLSPEDRENLCRVIGKFAHATKRRIQIDNYFCNEFIGLLQSCDTLPDEIKQKVVDFEMAEKMNPPVEKRRKKIPIGELEHDVKVIGKEAEAREIDVTAVTKEKIRTIPLDKFLE